MIVSYSLRLFSLRAKVIGKFIQRYTQSFTEGLYLRDSQTRDAHASFPVAYRLTTHPNGPGQTFLGETGLLSQLLEGGLGGWFRLD